MSTDLIVKSASSRPGAVGDEATIVIDGSGKVCEATPEAARMFGLSIDEFRNSALDRTVARDWDWALRNALLRLTCGSSDPFDLMVSDRHGRRRVLRLVPRRLRRRDAGVEYEIGVREQAALPVESEAVEPMHFDYDLLAREERLQRDVSISLQAHVASMVTMAKYMVEDAVGSIERGDAAERIPRLLRETVSCLRSTLNELQRIATELRPPLLDDLGLLPAIAALCRQFKASYPEVQLLTEVAVEEAAIATALKIDLFRIIEEALANAGNHANATTVRLALTEKDVRITLQVQDDGTGFDVAKVLRGEGAAAGLGVRSIARRVAGSRGDLLIDSVSGRGTSIAASWPLPQAPGSA